MQCHATAAWCWYSRPKVSAKLGMPGKVVAKCISDDVKQFASNVACPTWLTLHSASPKLQKIKGSADVFLGVMPTSCCACFAGL